MLIFENNSWHQEQLRFSLLSLLSSGQALFETIYYDQGVLYFWEEHLARLQNSLNDFQARVNWPDLKTIILRRLQNESAYRQARVKLICLLPLDRRNVKINAQHFLILVEAISPSQKEQAPLALKIFPSPYNEQAPLLQHKTINYGYHFYFRGLAQQQGFDDVLYVNKQGLLMETSIANIFGVKNGRLFTPPAEVGILPGTVRSLLVKELKAREALIHIDQLPQYDFFFVSSSVRELRFIRQIDGQKFAERYLSQFKTLVANWEAIKRQYRQRFLSG
ncbi:aminotransferase class IV [Calditrichota bacterium GD2]